MNGNIYNITGVLLKVAHITNQTKPKVLSKLYNIRQFDAVQT